MSIHPVRQEYGARYQDYGNDMIYPTIPDANGSSTLPPLQGAPPLQYDREIHYNNNMYSKGTQDEPSKKTKIKSFIKKNKIKIGVVCAVLVVLIISAIVLLVLLLDTNCKEGYSITDCSLECGITSKSSNFLKIVGGSNVVESSWPSIALIYFSYRTSSGQSTGSLCGGSLIDKETVLTAAHCFPTTVTISGNDYNVVTNSYYPTYASMYRVYLGVYDTDDLTSSAGVQQMSVKSFSLHESYSSSTLDNDIAIIRLNSKATLNSRVQVACLPHESSSSFPSPTITAYAAGWGTTSYSGSTSNILKDVDLKIYENSYCSWTSHSSRSQICAGDLTGTKDTCQGDSGGPLYIYKDIGGKNKFVSVGIVSYGYQCAVANRPAIYTRNSYYFDWIKKNA